MRHVLIIIVLMPLMSLAQNVFNNSLDEGLVSYYPFLLNANDMIGENDGILSNNVAETIDRFGVNNAALSFITANSSCGYSFIDIENQLINISDDYSVSIWINTSEPTASAQTIFNSINHDDGFSLNYNYDPNNNAQNDNMGNMLAWDAGKGKIVWNIVEQWSVWSGVLATAGDVVFYGTLDAYAKAVDAKTGKLLWKFKAPSGIIGNFNSWAHKGKQYVGVLSGIGGWAGAVVGG